MILFILGLVVGLIIGSGLGVFFMCLFMGSAEKSAPPTYAKGVSNRLD